MSTNFHADAYWLSTYLAYRLNIDPN